MDYRVVGTKTLLYGILKVHDRVVTHPNVSLVPKNRVFMFLKVHTPSLIDFLGRLACLSTSQ